MKKLNAKSIRAGQTIYRVFGLGKDSYLLQIHATGKPYPSKYCNGALFCKGREYDGYPYEFSLHDAGIIPNAYNQHRSFYSKKKAKRYLEQCLRADYKRPFVLEVEDFYDDCAYDYVEAGLEAYNGN